MTLATLTMPRFIEFAADGSPLAGGKVYFFAAGTSTPLDTYSDAAGTTPNSNPVVLDANGRATIYMGTSSLYKIRVDDADDNTIYTQDDYGGNFDVLIASAPVLQADMDVNGYGIISVTNGDIPITPHGTGNLRLTNPMLITNLDVNGQSIVSTSNGNITITPDGTGVTIIDSLKLSGTMDGDNNTIQNIAVQNTIGTHAVEFNGDGDYIIYLSAQVAETLRDFIAISSGAGVSFDVELKIAGATTASLTGVSNAESNDNTFSDDSVAVGQKLSVTVSNFSGSGTGEAYIETAKTVTAAG